MKSLSLYNYFRSSTSYRVRIALHWKNIDFSYVPINLLKNEQRSAEYLKLNPLGGVPTLIHDNKVIPESVAILEYLEEKFTNNPLLPTDAYLRARIRQFVEIVNSGIHPLGNLKTLKYLETHHAYDQKQKEAWIAHWAHQGLVALEEMAKEFSGLYSFGDQITLADVVLVPQLLSCQRFNVSLEAYPTLLKINENCLKLEAFQKASPFKQIDTPDDLRK